MLIGGIQKLSLIDFPKKVAAVVFTQGCFFRCHFCHNPSLVLPEEFSQTFKEKDFFTFLDSRKDKLDGVVISGGEPTLHSDLSSFIKKIKKKGFLIKLDTAGIFPNKIQSLLEENLLDYIAMDIKAPLDKYSLVTVKTPPKGSIEKSISLIMHSAIDYEFRTTLLEKLHTKDDVIHILKWIKGAKCYFLQKFKPGRTVSSSFIHERTLSNSDLDHLALLAKDYVDLCQIR